MAEYGDSANGNSFFEANREWHDIKMTLKNFKHTF